MDEFWVFLCDCDGIWQLADRSLPDNRCYFPDLKTTLKVLPILRSIGQIGEQYVCDFKEYAVMNTHGVIAQSKNAPINALLELCRSKDD